MQFAKNKTAIIAIVIFLMLSMSASMILLPSAVAHTPAWQIPTYAYINAAPNPVGVGQEVNVFMFLTNYFYGSAYGTNLYRFHNYMLTITSPSGNVTTQTFAVIIDTTSNQLAKFVPTETGTYNLTFTYPGQTITVNDQDPGSLYVNDTFLPSSASMSLTVQQEPIPPGVDSYPLPNAYWTRPIYGENSYWFTISSNWLGTGAPGYGGYTNLAEALSGAYNGQATFPGDAIGSQTSHVMWTKPFQSGGVVGGNDVGAGQTYFDGSAYLIRYNNPIIIDGKLFYTDVSSFSGTGYLVGLGGAQTGPTNCVDLTTGKLIWSRTDVPVLSFGLVFNVQTQNEHGVTPPILIATNAFFGGAMTASTWYGYDADTGDPIFNVTNIPSGVDRAMGPSGEYIMWVIANAGTASNPDWRLGQWNSSKLFLPDGSASPNLVGTIDGSISTGPNTRYDWNVSLPWLNTMPNVSPTVQASIFNPTTNPTVERAKLGDVMLCYNGTLPSSGENNLFITPSSTPYTYFAVNLNASKGAIGSVLWSKTLQPPANNYTVVPSGVDFDTRVFLETWKEATKWVAYDLDSGNKLWEGEPQAAFDYYGSPSAGVLSGQIAYGNIYSSAMGGILYCYDDRSGHILWTYGNGGEGNSTNSGVNWPYGNIPTFINAVGNGIIYTVTSEHTWVSPIYKGGLQRAINATDGTEIWTISSVTMEFGSTSYAMADGFNTWFNGYDNQIYVVGRGPSATTVEAPAADIALGSGLVIRGSVTDISSGTTQTQPAADFPNGVPVASDASMKDWMGFVYQQKPEPSNFTGVPVSINVLDSNNNFRNIGTAVTDATGRYSLTWKPDISGNFTVYANFAGTKGYWSSYAVTNFAVDEVAAHPTPTVTAQTNVATTTDLMLYIVGATIAIIIAIAIGFALVLRKRP